MTATPAVRRSWRLLPALGILGADALSKAWVIRALGGRGVLWVWRPLLSLRLLYNPGAGLGSGADHAWAATILCAGAVALLAFWLLRAERGRFGLTLMLGGVAGDLAGHLGPGTVADFINLWLWPGIFNLADVSLRLGAVCFAVGWLRRGQPGKR